jgi:hypothetical protein
VNRHSSRKNPLEASWLKIFEDSSAPKRFGQWYQGVTLTRYQPGLIHYHEVNDLPRKTGPNTMQMPGCSSASLHLFRSASDAELCECQINSAFLPAFFLLIGDFLKKKRFSLFFALLTTL